MRKPFVFLACALLVSATAAVRADEKIDPAAVVDKAIKASGGAEKLAKYKAASAKMKGKFYGSGADGLEFEGEVDSQYPDKFRLKVESDVMGMKFGYSKVINGDKVWIKMNTDTTEIKDKEGIKDAQEELYVRGIVQLLPLKEDKNLKIELVGESKVDDKPVIGLRVSSKGHRDVNLYFDKDKGLLVKSETMIRDEMTGGKEQMQETVYSNFKEIGGVLHAMKIVISREGKKHVESEITEVTPKEKIDDKVFGKP
jgi:outer membrane lipoprotein-sorting protein